MSIGDDIWAALEDVMHSPVDDYQIRQICDILEVEYPESAHSAFAVDAIQDHMRIAESVGMGIEEWYETVIADHREQFGYESETFPRLLAFYRENPELFED